MSEYIKGLRDAEKACKGVQESGCEVAAGAVECIKSIQDMILIAGLSAPSVAGGAQELPRPCNHCIGGKVKSGLTMMEQPCHICAGSGVIWPVKGLAAAIAAQAKPVEMSDEKIIEIFQSMEGLIPDPLKFAHAILANSAPNKALVELLQSWMRHNGTFGDRIWLVDRTVAALKAAGVEV